MLHKAVGTHEEAEETAVAVNFLNTVEYTADHVVTTGSLAAAEDYTYIDRLACCRVGVLFKADFRQTVSVGKQGLDCFLVGYRLGGLALHYTHCSGKSDGKFRLISRTGFL